MKKNFLFSLLLLPTLLIAQVDSSSIIYSNEIDSLKLKEYVLVLSNDTLLGRETAMEGQKRAEKYLREQFKSIGLSPAVNGKFVQDFSVVTNNINTVSIKLNKTPIKDSLGVFSTAFINDTILNFSDYIFLGHGISCMEYDDYKDVSVLNKLVFMYEEDPVDESGHPIISKEEIKNWYNDDRASYAKNKGASGVVFISKKLSNTKNYFKRYFNYRDLSLIEEDSFFPTFYVNESIFYNLFTCDSNDVYKFIYGKKSRRIRKKFTLQEELSFSIKADREMLTSSNIVGKLESDNIDSPWIVLTAHYDHEGYSGDKIYNGADDNASGTASVMAIASAMINAKKNGVSFSNNILFMLVSGEEKGLLGSKYYVSNPIIPLENTLCNLNIDMIGRYDQKHNIDDQYIYIIGSNRISKELHEINEEMNDSYTNLDLDYTYNKADDPNHYYTRSDHYNFAKKGVPIIFYFDGGNADYHKPTDTEEKISYPLLTKRSKLVFHTTWFLAKRNGTKLN